MAFRNILSACVANLSHIIEEAWPLISHSQNGPLLLTYARTAPWREPVTE